MSDSPTRLWVALFVGLVFVCGLSLGLAAGPWLGRGLEQQQDRDRFPGPRRPGGPRGDRGFVSERILNRLGQDPTFTDDQRQQLTALFADREGRFRQFNREMRGRFETERTRLHEDISAILTSEQMELFERARRPGRRRRGPESDQRDR